MSSGSAVRFPIIVTGDKFTGLSLFSNRCPRAFTPYTQGGTVSSMSTQSSAEIRLTLSDLIANTIYSFLDNSDNSPEEERERRLATQDTADDILNVLGLVIKENQDVQSGIEALISRDIPDDFGI